MERAKKLGLAQSGLADLIVTTYVYEANDLFDTQHRGRLFSVFRHPVDRAISMFHYLQYVRFFLILYETKMNYFPYFHYPPRDHPLLFITCKLFFLLLFLFLG